MTNVCAVAAFHAGLAETIRTVVAQCIAGGAGACGARAAFMAFLAEHGCAILAGLVAVRADINTIGTGAAGAAEFRSAIDTNTAVLA